MSHSKLLIVNPGAGAVTEEVAERLRREFPDYHVVNFPPEQELESLLTEEALVVAAGGDGTIGAVARMLAGSGHSLGILPMGTFNNFARSVGLPIELDDAIRVIKAGKPAGVSLGQVNGTTFVEAAALGFFGESIVIGEHVKDLHFGELGDGLRRLATARQFRYRVSGDLNLQGTALSVIAANTPSTGSLIPVGRADPEDPFLNLGVARGGSRFGRLLNMILRRPAIDSGTSRKFSRIRIETDEPVPVVADNASEGTTPVEIRALADGLRVILPA